MKNKLLLFTAILILSTGCSYLPADSNKSVSEQAVDSTVGAEKIGIPECDTLIDELAAFSQNPDDNFAARTAKRAAANKVREKLIQRIEQNKTDKAKLAKDCTDYKAQFDMLRNEWNK
jgi:hypothetical protein